MKRTFDLFFIVFSLPFWLVVMAGISLWIKWSSPGPVFFKQERVGFRGRRFMIFKFRSMKISAETQSHESHFDRLVETNCPMTKLDEAGDPRLISGGRLLRATGLDELPQLLNVILGDMSLVGPRPCTSKELRRYQTKHMERFAAQPGMTGFWQVSGKNKTTFSEMIDLDIQYARNWSLWLDLVILLKTLPALANQVRESQFKRRQRRQELFGEQMTEVETNKRAAVSV